MCAKESLGSQSEYYHFGEKLRKLRKIHGETQKELANAIGLTENAICNYEKGERTPDVFTMRKIAKHFNMTLHSLLRGDYVDVELPKDLPVDDLEFQEYALYKMLPYVWLEEDLEDDDFKRAFESSDELVQSMIYQSDSFDWSQIEKCVELHEKAAEKGVLSAYAGLLWLDAFQAYIISLSGTKVQELLSDSSTTATSEDIFKAYFLSSITDKIDDELEQEKTEMMTQLRRKIFRDVYYLKNVDDSELSSLADFYLAVGHLNNILETGLSREENRLIGSHMLTICRVLQNQYALDFMTALDPSESEEE